MNIFIRKIKKQEDGLSIIEVQEVKIGLTWQKGETWRFYHLKSETYADFPVKEEGVDFLVEQEVGTKK